MAEELAILSLGLGVIGLELEELAIIPLELEVLLLVGVVLELEAE